MTEGTRPEGGFEPPSGAGAGGGGAGADGGAGAGGASGAGSDTAGGQWLPPVPPGPPPGSPPPTAPPGWRVSPKAIDLDPNAPSGPEPWADPGNSPAAPGLGFSVAASGLLYYTLALFAIPVAIAGTVLSAIAYRRLRSGETRKGRIESTVGLAVGIGSLLIAVVAVVVTAVAD
jgi:hypothetical protein